MVAPSMPDAEKVTAVREALPAVAAGIYLNTPVAGPLPAETAAAMAEIAEWDLRTGRAHRDRRSDVESRLEEARAAVAAILATDLDAVALVAGVRDALAHALRTLDWRPGDRIVFVDDPALAAIEDAAPPGVAIERTEPGRLDEVFARRGVRLLALPLVRSMTGERLPVESIAAEAHRHGATVVVEASLAVGAMPVSPSELGADVLVARSEAWLLGPEGLAIVAAPDAGARQRIDGFHLPSVVGFARGCGWLAMYVGLGWLFDRARALTDRAVERLAAVPGVTLVTPADRATTLVFTIDGWTADAVLDELGARIFLLASAVGGGTIRIGLGAWNTEDELDRLADGVALLAAHTPETLPRRPRLAMLGDAP